MIKYKIGNILNEDVEAIVNTVNCVGVMGRGIALQFKNMFPQNFKAYSAACAREELQPGKMFVYETNELTNPKYIINFPTKRHWRGKSRIEDIKTGLEDLVKQIKAHGIKSIAIPPLGSGLGGLNWNEVRPLIEQTFAEFAEIEVTIFEPQDTVDVEKMVKSRDVPSMSAGRAALVALMQRYLNGLMDPFVTLLELHKLMYFMQEAGEPLKLRYQQAPYGPYAENLRHVLKALEGHFVSGYADGGDAPNKELKLVPGAVTEAENFLTNEKDTKYRLDKVANLVEGFETPFGLELLATVHWTVTKINAHSVDEVVSKVYAWNDRKKQFSERQINIAYKVLHENNWIN